MTMYAKGMSQRDIEDTIHEIYGIEASQTLISRITDKIFPEVNEWQNRPLDKIYPVIFGVEDIFVACHDNLTGLCEAINSILPKTKNQQ